jgi:putative ABC transport system permease protein
MMGRSPGFAAVAILSLALGIGANTAIFSLIDSVMLRTLPVAHPEQLVEFLNHYPGEPRGNGFSLASYEHYRDNNHVLLGLTGSTMSLLHVRSEGRERETLDGQYVLENFFPTLGVKPAMGRLIGPGDSAVAVVSWSYWKRGFNQEPSIVGRRIVVNDVPLTIIGVTPPEFFGLLTGYRPEIWASMPAQPVSLALVGKLKPSVSLEQARAEMAVLYQFTIEERARASRDAMTRQLKIEVEPAGSGLSALRDRFKRPLLLLMGVVGLLLLLASINLASMLLARGAVRQREMALRISLGASRLRVVRQVLTESLLLSAAGALFGVVLAYFGAAGLVRILAGGRQVPGLPASIEIPVEINLDVLLFTAGVAVLTGVLFGIAPAWSAFALAPASGLGRSRRRVGKSLIAAQVALSLVLLSGAGVLVRYLWNLRNVNLGFARDHVLLVSLDPARGGYDPTRLSRGYQELLSRFQAIPGVRSATLSGTTPINGAAASGLANVEGHPEPPDGRRYVAINWVAPKFFETFGTPLLAGRDFSFQDALDRPRVAIVNQSLARYYFGVASPIGRHVTLEHVTGGRNFPPVEIIGIVGDAKYAELREAAPRTIYLDAFQREGAFSQFSLRTNVEPAGVVDEVRRAVRDSLTNVAVARVTTLADQMDASIVVERLIASISEWFAALGAMLVAIGIYGLLAYSVARRTHEIGIRMALGATRGAVARMVVADALGMVGSGLIIGAPVAFWSKRVASSLMGDLPMGSIAPVVFGAAVMVMVALVATYLPARRAAGVEPMEALRHE